MASVINGVTCQGTESSLLQCQRQVEIALQYCNLSTTAAVSCQGVYHIILYKTLLMAVSRNIEDMVL